MNHVGYFFGVFSAIFVKNIEKLMLIGGFFETATI